jgi:hypothetical protein
VLRADRNLGEFDITSDVKFTKNRLDTPLARSRIVAPGENRRICLDRGLDTIVDRGIGPVEYLNSYRGRSGRAPGSTDPELPPIDRGRLDPHYQVTVMA